MSAASRSLWELLLLTREAGASAQLTCEECFVLLEYDAELLSNGATLDKLHPAIRNHLSLCSKCKTKIDEWLRKPGEVPYTPERVQRALEKAHENEHDSNLENIENGRSKQVSSNVK